MGIDGIALCAAANTMPQMDRLFATHANLLSRIA